MTANAMSGDRERCVDAGMHDYLPKPVRIDELAAALGRCIARQGGVDGRPLARAPLAAPIAAPVSADVEQAGTAGSFGAGLDSATLTRLRAELGDELARSVLESYVEDTPPLVDALRAGLGSSDLDAVRRAAHDEVDQPVRSARSTPRPWPSASRAQRAKAPRCRKPRSTASGAW
ncbi:MAG: hypothetical protein IPK07_31800 [Deltaproteobacteria bacterium]|nr:hypothetical protein [Deltaproteobacteria bacterium]